MKKSIVSFVMLLVAALMLSGCILVPVPVGHRDGGYRDGSDHREGGNYRNGGDRR